MTGLLEYLCYLIVTILLEYIVYNSRFMDMIRMYCMYTNIVSHSCYIVTYVHNILDVFIPHLYIPDHQDRNNLPHIH